MTSKQKWALAGVLLLSIFFRFYQIQSMPGGLFPDEAANGIDINAMQRGELQPFYERGNGREALFFYMLWGSVEIFGKGHWQHHIVSALVGILAVLGCFLVTKKLFSEFSGKPERAIKIALLASFFMAVSSWHTVLSRTAFRANLIPLFTAFTFYFLLLTYSAQTKAKRYFWSILTGATFALGFYSYIAYRIMVPLIAVAILWPLITDLFLSKDRLVHFKKFALPIIAIGISFAIFIAPLAHYFYTHPGSFIGRSGQVSVFNPELNGGDLIGTVLEVTRLSMKAYFWNGDLNWRHNISGEPFLSVMVSPFFAVGLTLTTLLAIRYMIMPWRRRNDWKFFLLTGWFWAMLIPVVTTAEGIPHGLRAIGTIPVVFIMAAFGLVVIMEVVGHSVAMFWPYIVGWKRKILTFAFQAKTVAYIVALILQPFILYFILAANSPENFYAFRSDLTVVSNYLNNYGDKSNTYLVLDKFSIQTVDYVTTIDGRNPNNPRNNPYVQVDPEDSWKLENLKPGDVIVFTQSSIFDIKKFKAFHPNIELVREERNKFRQTVMAIYEVK